MSILNDENNRQNQQGNKEIPLPQEYKNSIKNIQQQSGEYYLRLGQIEYEINMLNIEKNDILKNLEDLTNKANLLHNKLIKEYGDGEILLDKGIIKQIK